MKKICDYLPFYLFENGLKTAKGDTKRVKYFDNLNTPKECIFWW